MAEKGGEIDFPCPDCGAMITLVVPPGAVYGMKLSSECTACGEPIEATYEVDPS